MTNPISDFIEINFRINSDSGEKTICTIPISDLSIDPTGSIHIRVNPRNLYQLMFEPTTNNDLKKTIEVPPVTSITSITFCYTSDSQNKRDVLLLNDGNFFSGGRPTRAINIKLSSLYEKILELGPSTEGTGQYKIKNIFTLTFGSKYISSVGQFPVIVQETVNKPAHVIGGTKACKIYIDNP